MVYIESDAVSCHFLLFSGGMAGEQIRTSVSTSRRRSRCTYLLSGHAPAEEQKVTGNGVTLYIDHNLLDEVDYTYICEVA